MLHEGSKQQLLYISESFEATKVLICIAKVPYIIEPKKLRDIESHLKYRKWPLPQNSGNDH